MIMKNYFMKSSVALMTLSAALASCTQDEIVQNNVPTRQALNISVNTQDFVSEDGSRATTGTDAGRTTVFVEGDEMGMYVISSDGTVICNNEKFVYNGTAWEAANQLYYWKNADYIVYYPYDESLTVESILDVDDTASSEETDPSEEMTIVDALKAKFARTENFYTQNTAETYEKADLMLAEVNSPKNGEIKFNLAHQFSMVEINVPVRRYVTTDAQGKFEYTAPASLTWDTPLKIGENVVDPYSTGKGSFRFIVPSGVDLNLTLDGHLVYDEGVSVNFGSSEQSQSINLPSGTCKVYNVTYGGVENTVVTRDLEVGDYYYADGSIYPYGNQSENDLTKPVKEGCIGVIFEVGVGAGISDTKWNHGSVLALNNAHPDFSQWGDRTAEIPQNGNSFVEGVDTDLYTFLSGKKNGYAMTTTFAEKYKGDCAFSKIKVLGTSSASVDFMGYTAPEGSSGWYMPSVGQLMAVWSGLGGYEVKADNYENSKANGFNEGKVESVNKIKGAIEKVGGTFVGHSNEDKNNNLQKWWSTTENGNDKVWIIEWNLNPDNNWSTGISSSSKTGDWKAAQTYARPILSF